MRRGGAQRAPPRLCERDLPLTEGFGAFANPCRKEGRDFVGINGVKWQHVRPCGQHHGVFQSITWHHDETGVLPLQIPCKCGQACQIVGAEVGAVVYDDTAVLQIMHGDLVL